MSCLPRLRAVPACGPFDQRPHGAASQLLGKVDIGDGDSLGEPPGWSPPLATTAVPVPADRKLSLYWWGDKQAESQLFYLLGETDQGSGLGLGRWSIFLANVGEGHSRAESHAALVSKSR